MRAMTAMIVALTVGTAAPAVAAPITTATPIRFTLFRDSKIFADGAVNAVPTPLLLDSGAGMSVIDRDYAARLHLAAAGRALAHGTGGVEQGTLVSGVTVVVGGARLSGITALVLDLAPLSRALGRPVAFVLGRELFATRRVTIDFAGSTLTIDYPDRPPPVGATPLSLTPHGALFTVPIRIGDLPPVAADLDLGNGGALLMSDPYAHRSREIGALRHAPGEGGGVGGLREIDRVTLPKVSIGPYAIEHVPAEINRGAVVPLDGVNLGIQLLRNFVVTLDLGHCRLWLAPAATPVPPPKERAGLRLEQDGGALRVAYLAPTGPAKAAGLERDDRIVAIDGRPVDASYYPAGRFRWSNGPPGEAHRLRLTSGAERVVVLADYF